MFIRLLKKRVDGILIIDNRYTIMLLYPMYVIIEINIQVNKFSLLLVFFMYKNEHMNNI